MRGRREEYKAAGSRAHFAGASQRYHEVALRPCPAGLRSSTSRRDKATVKICQASFFVAAVSCLPQFRWTRAEWFEYPLLSVTWQKDQRLGASTTVRLITVRGIGQDLWSWKPAKRAKPTAGPETPANDLSR